MYWQPTARFMIDITCKLTGKRALNRTLDLIKCWTVTLMEMLRRQHRELSWLSGHWSLICMKTSPQKMIRDGATMTSNVRDNRIVPSLWSFSMTEYAITQQKLFTRRHMQVNQPQQWASTSSQISACQSCVLAWACRCAFACCTSTYTTH